MFKITNDAIARVKKLMKKENLTNSVLRIGVKGGGCSGFSYVVDFDNVINDNDIVSSIDQLTIVCDPKSFEYLKNVEIYYDKNLLNGGLKFKNPNAKKSCSCDMSFSM